MTVNDIVSLETNGTAIGQTKAVPPGEVALDPTLLDALDSYRKSRRRNPWDKKSVILVFEWQYPQGTVEKPFPVSLRRDEPDRNPPSFTFPGQLKGYQTWIYHESADAFIPGDRIQWILQAENFKWVFRVKRDV